MELLERAQALAALAEARTAAARGEGRVVLVTGEAGIGKTSLVNEFVRRLDGDARVLLGTCDDLSIPRPLGPIRDLIGSVSTPLEEALFAGAAPHDIQMLLHAELERPPHPTVLVLEDVHWADDATCDAITVLGRRIRGLPAVLVLTFRDGEAPPGHPLHAAIGAIRAGDATIVELRPLSLSAVASLAGDDTEAVYAATRGNPFYVTELLAERTAATLPASVANAVLGRVSRLEEDERRLLELVSVAPGRMRTSLLDDLMPGWPGAAVEPERRRLLDVASAHVRFRHELARHAIRTSLPTAEGRRLHGAILDALLETNADPADIVHHAEAAGAEDVVGDYALVAARHAAALSSNREAFSHYRRAADFADRLQPTEQARMFEELSALASLTNKLDPAFDAIERAIELYRGLGDTEAVGRCTRALSRLFWFSGAGGAARAAALEAVAILEPLGESTELGRAYSGLSQLAMLAEESDAAIEWGERALELATRLGDEGTRAHALDNVSTVRIQLDQTAIGPLLEAHAIADAVGNHEEATRALINLSYALMSWAKADTAMEYTQRAFAYACEHEMHTFASYIVEIEAWLHLRAGRWDEAERLTRAELEKGLTIVQLLGKTILTELAIRRGDPDADARLAELADQAELTGESQRVTPVLELICERALIEGEPLPAERLRKLVTGVRKWGRYDVRRAAWAAVAGVDSEFDRATPGPHAAMARRDWQGAADAFGAVGWSYDRALMLLLVGDEDSLVEALEIARGLGAEPLARRAATVLRERGLRVPAGPREATRGNVAGLTARQLEVLGLLVDGLTNAEIADRLVVSPRTVEHHVAAVLTKLGATTRREAARRAAELRT